MSLNSVAIVLKNTVLSVVTFPVLPNQDPESRYPLQGLYRPCTTSKRKRKFQLREPHVVSRTPHSGHRGSYKEVVNALACYLIGVRVQISIQKPIFDIFQSFFIRQVMHK